MDFRRMLGFVLFGTYIICWVLYRWEEKKNWKTHPKALEPPEPTHTMAVLSLLMWVVFIALVAMVVLRSRWLFNWKPFIA